MVVKSSKMGERWERRWVDERTVHHLMEKVLTGNNAT